MDEHGYYFTNLLNDGTNVDEFNTQSVGQISHSSPISPQIEFTTKKPRGGNFTVEEDLVLISGWLNTSVDVVHENEQKSKRYWQRVFEYFNEYKPQSDYNRNPVSLMNRWLTIQLATNKFCGCFNQIEMLNQSGLTEKDKVRDAKKMYKELHKSSFPFEHCWNELRYHPKWMEDSQSKKQKIKSDATPSSSNFSTSESVNIGDDSGGLERPTGRKTAKERARKSKTKLSEGDNSSSTYFVNLLEEMKEEKKKMAEKKVDFMEKMVAVEQEKVAVEQKKVQLEQMKEEQKIMLIDTSVLPPIQAEYFKRLQMEIMAK